MADLRSKGYEASGTPADVSREGDLKRLLDFAHETYGGIDVWINNAGISGGYRTLESMSPAEVREVLDINLLGTLAACRLLIAYFRQKSGGIILNMSGRGGRGNAAPYQAPYAATKAAVVSLTRSLAAENRCHHISINCIAPGMVATDMYRDAATCPETENRLVLIPVLLKAFATPMPDVQKLVVRLCAQEPGQTTGKCYSAERWTRWIRALLAALEFVKVIRKMRRKEDE